MSSSCLRVLVAAAAVLAATAATVVGIAPAAADPAPLPAPSATPARVVVGTTTVVAGSGCLSANGGGSGVSAWLASADGAAVGQRRDLRSDDDGTWSLRLTVPLGTVTTAPLVVRSTCGYADLGDLRAYPDAPLTLLPSRATPWQAGQPALPEVPNGRLDAVSCATPTTCVAVGASRQGAVSTPVAEVWSGGAWSVSALPALPTSRGASLAGVSCASASSCVAVGRVTTPDGVRPLAAALTRGSWKLTVLPVTSDNPNVTEADLAGVSCGSTTACVAVGRAGSLTGSLPFWAPTAYVLTGTRWAPAPPTPRFGTELDAVSCRSTGECVAVGSPEVGDGTAVQLFDGASWSDGPLPADPDVRLGAVSCPATGSCVAVGLVTDGQVDTPLQPWAGRLDLAGWTPVALGDGVGTGRLDAVSCASDTVCVAVGRRGTLQTHAEAFGVRGIGDAWTAAVAPAGTTLTALSCPRVTVCTTVGVAAGAPTALRGTGASWTVATVPAPVGLPDGGFDAVACPADDACTAVGRQVDAVGVQRPLVDRWDGTAWSLQTVPDLPGARLTGLSCPTTTLCVAVGELTAAGAPRRTLALQWDPTGGWRQVGTEATVDGGFTAVSCGGPGSCLAVGSDETTGPFAVALRAGTWTRVATPPADTLRRVTMPAVSCVGQVCRTAVNGSTGDFSDVTIGLRYAGGSWTADAPRPGTTSAVSCVTTTRCAQTLLGGAAPLVVRVAGAVQAVDELPVDGLRGTVLSGLACRDNLKCVAVGASDRGPSLIRWTGRVWQLEPVAPAVRVAAAANAVACAPDGGRCVAVGGGDGPDDGPPTILVSTATAG